MIVHRGGDRGQTLPLFIWITGIILFVAFAFFAFAQAAVARSGAQAAADSAALAAAQDGRDDLVEGLLDSFGKGDDWVDWLSGVAPHGANAQEAASDLAAQNDASVLAIEKVSVRGLDGYSVSVETRYTVGESVIPGTESMRAKADAVAVIEPRCDVRGDFDPSDSVSFVCDGDVFELDPEDFEDSDVPDSSVLFSVYLVG
ncbi:pilus assembly protein TadG-related protein [Streptomyces albidoflavus]|uniref:pilus assembly protein TadG-related protein n=1 Tax=Streptomyces albidoflavus TaxID=1886 RepID=UPI002B2784AB|nr:pilus assembly protein TadG-related protein [Streptomyces albidoflavus]